MGEVHNSQQEYCFSDDHMIVKITYFNYGKHLKDIKIYQWYIVLLRAFLCEIKDSKFHLAKYSSLNKKHGVIFAAQVIAIESLRTHIIIQANLLSIEILVCL